MCNYIKGVTSWYTFYWLNLISNQSDCFWVCLILNVQQKTSSQTSAFKHLYNMGTSILQTVLSVLKMYQTLLYFTLLDFILQIYTFVMQTLCSVPLVSVLWRCHCSYSVSVLILRSHPVQLQCLSNLHNVAMDSHIYISLHLLLFSTGCCSCYLHKSHAGSSEKFTTCK